MEQRIKDCLSGNHGSYILPFLWLHGESRERVREEILAIKNSGIMEFCAESRPYENFCRDEWWDDFKFILETARELGMRVWLLDDKKFPSGYANGYLESPENAHLRKRHIRELQIEVVGPMKNAKLFIGGRVGEEEKVIQIIAYRHTGRDEQLDYRTATDITHTLSDKMAYWDIPSGVWRVCVTVDTPSTEYCEERYKYYIDMLNPDSCHAMIDAVYQPHYEHFSEYFGNTFAGFFSDEPGFLNVVNTYYNKLGMMHSPYPWREDLVSLIAENAGVCENEIAPYIPALWEDLGEITPFIRSNYMDTISKLYSKNFGYMLGNWCREHGVMYIGHVIEDMGAHTRMGYGSGHYFRALDGQDMAGVDIVLTQDIPGVLNANHRSLLTDGGKADPAFFHYTMPKLASSHSHIQPLKKGRAMCEIFGAFGWAEGLPYMKALADSMIVSGINYFVPHAFSPREEDEDCPPHFYNGGKNIQYPLFKNLMNYMGRCSHILNGTLHKADVAVFYNAEGEWTGGKNQLFYEICRILTQGLIDFDIIPYDAMKDAKVENGRLTVNGEDYGALIVSQADIMPIKCLAEMARLAEDGLEVIFADSLPISSAEGTDISELSKHFDTVPSHELPTKLRACGLCQIMPLSEGYELVRFYHATENGKDIYLFSNEDIYGNADVSLSLPNSGEYLIYEPWENKCYKSCTNGELLHLNIEKGNMLFVIFGAEIPKDTPYFTYEVQRKALPLRFDISLKEEGESQYRTVATSAECFDISAPERYPSFSGSVLYKASLEVPKGFTVLDLGQVGEVAEAYLNGKYLGARINAPYKFDLSSALQEGENSLEIVVTSNLAHRRRDLFSSFIQIPPTGIIGDVSICKYSKE